MLYDERETRRREFIRHFIEQEQTTNQRLASETLTDDSEESKLASARKQVFAMLNEQMPPAFKQLKKEEEQKMIDCYVPPDAQYAQCEQGPSEGSNYRSTATHKPLTIISLGNEYNHPSPEEMDSVREQLIDMGIQDFLVVPYQVAIHQTYVPMVEEKEVIQSQSPPVGILNLYQNIERQLIEAFKNIDAEIPGFPPSIDEKTFWQVLQVVREAIHQSPKHPPLSTSDNWKERIKTLGSSDCPHTKPAAENKEMAQKTQSIKYGGSPSSSLNRRLEKENFVKGIVETFQRDWSGHKDMIDIAYPEEATQAVCEAVEV